MSPPSGGSIPPCTWSGARRGNRHKRPASPGIHENTLGRYADEGRRQTIRTASGQRGYDVAAVLPESAEAALVCYCRGSSAKQIVSDIGGGLNFGRKGLVAILERFQRGDKLRIVVAHRDRLARLGFELIQWLAEQNGDGVVVLDNPDYSPEQELTQDILAVLHPFSCRLHRLRRYRNAVKADSGLSDEGATEETQAVV